MRSRKGISTVITALVSVVAVLGTALFFMQSNSNLFVGLSAQQDEQSPTPVQSESTKPVADVTAPESAPSPALPDKEGLDVTISDVSVTRLAQDRMELRPVLAIRNPTDDRMVVSRIDFAFYADGVLLGSHAVSFESIPLNGRPVIAAEDSVSITTATGQPFVLEYETRIAEIYAKIRDSPGKVWWSARGEVLAESEVTKENFLFESSAYTGPRQMTLIDKCQLYGVPATECSENAVLAKKRLVYSQQSGLFTDDGTILVTNLHSWVSSTNAATAFVVKNGGNSTITINYIALRGLDVPADTWWSTKGATLGQLQYPLPVSYAASSGNVAGISGTFLPGTIFLNPGQSAVVYLLGAGNMKAVDAGNTYSLQVQAGHLGTVKQVQVIAASG